MNNRNRSQYSDVKVVARLWLREHGCRYLHSDNVSDGDCHQWIEQLTDESIASGVVQRCQMGTQKNAYVISRRMPDPNNPERNVTNLWLFVDPRGQLTSSQLAHFAEVPWFASNQEEFELLIHRKLDELPSQMASQAASSGTPFSGKIRSAARTPTKIFAVLFLFAIGIIAVWWRPIGFVEQEPDIEVNVEPSPSIDQRWNEEYIRDGIETAIDDAELIEVSAHDLTDVELLNTFIELFRISDSELGLDASDGVNMDARRKSAPHPFLAFLDHFPRETPRADSDDNKTWPELCAALLIPLARSFGDASENRTPTGLPLEDANPREIIEWLRNQLNYEGFYRTWHAKELPNTTEDPFVKNWDSDDPANQWQRKVRAFLKKHYAH